MQKVDFFERVAKYNYGMISKLVLGEEDTKVFYAEIENLLRRYTKVSKRDGWDDMDILANSKESWYKKSEKRLLKLILKILSIDNYEIDDLSIDDISIKFNRNKSDNLTMKANFISTMVGTNKFDIQDVIELAATTTDSKSMAERGEAYQKAHAQETQKIQETKVSKVDENIKVSETKD